MLKVYLDNASTTRVHPDVRDAMEPCFGETYGNPSSLHAAGRAARKAVEDARETLAGRLGADPKEILFTSCATEADNLALFGVAAALHAKGNHIVTSAVEHPAVLSACGELEKRGCRVTRVPVDREGRVDPRDVEKAITPKTILVSIMLANNEVGTVQPIAEIARPKGVYLHTDAAQACGKIAVDLEGVDLLTFSGHKMHAPKGIGGLFVRKGTPLAPVIVGGGQEFERRSGTENVPYIVGLARAFTLKPDLKRVERLREKLRSGLERVERIRVNGHPIHRLPTILNVTFEGIDGEAIILALDAEGICVSSGSACASQSMEPSHVLLAMGLTRDEARGSVRFSLSAETTEEEIARTLEVVPKVVARLRKISPAWTTNSP